MNLKWKIALFMTFFLFFGLLIATSLNPALAKEVKDITFECKYDKKEDKYVCILPPVLVKKGLEMELFGTEYYPNANGTVFLQLIDDNIPINNGYCELTVYYPDKTKWISSYPMTHLKGSNGLYYFDFITPPKFGVYMVDAYCFYADIRHKFSPFNVTYDGILFEGSAGDVREVVNNDCIMLKTSGSHFHEVYFKDNSIIGLNLSHITKIDIAWAGQNDKLSRLEIYNWRNLSWVSIGTIGKHAVGECHLTKYFTGGVTLNISDYVRTDVVRARIFSIEKGKIFTDSFSLFFHSNASVVSTIRGGGEIHVLDFNSTFNTTGVPKKLYKIQEDIASVNYTVKEGFNTTWKLIEGVNITIINATLNITFPVANITEPILLDLEEVKALLFALHSTPVTKQYCIDNQTLAIEKVVNWTVKGVEYPITKYETMLCPYGCNIKDNECFKAPYVRIIWVAGIVVGILILLGLLWFFRVI